MFYDGLAFILKAHDQSDGFGRVPSGRAIRSKSSFGSY
ncbi:MAG: hypothetical protein JWM14_2823 [Chitinophagaceae bacterium]|nr:hypothetical protein [Chitinophagaceae bacterium]